MTEKSQNVEDKKSPMPDSKGDFLVAPQSYDKEFADTFAELPLRWRQYLTTREEVLNKGFDDMAGRVDTNKWLADAYGAIIDDLRQQGITNPKEWLKSLVELDCKLKKDPQGTLATVAQSYGMDLSKPTASGDKDATSKAMQQVLTEQMVAKQIYDFVNGKNEQGELKHPFYGDVVRDMHDLLSKGTAQSLDDAYDMAVWLNQATRSKLLSQKIQAALKDKSLEAKKAENIAFDFHGKSQPETKKLTLREDLEQRFAALGYVDE